LLAATHRNPAYAQAYAYLGYTFDKLGHPGWGLASLNHALHLDPQSAVALTLSGLYWDQHGDPELARHYYQVAYKRDPDNAALCLEIAATYADQGNYTATEVWLLFAAELAPQDPQVWEVLARYYLESGIGVDSSGLSAANRLLALSADDALAHDLVGWAYFLAARETEAEASLLQALDLDPTLASAHYHLGRLRAHQSRYAEAVQAYRQAADYDRAGQLEIALERAWEELPNVYQDGSTSRLKNAP
jgi:tetratricopeptide (TPR) repeat protein